MKRGRLKKSKPAKREELDSSQSHKLASGGAIPPPATTEPIPPFSFRVTEHEATRLREGDIIEYDFAEYLVVKVNPSCARIIPAHSMERKTVSFTPRFADKPVSFSVPVKLDPISISANAECLIIRRLGPQWKEKLTRMGREAATCE